MKFSPANTKLKKLEKKTGRKVYSFDLLSGHTCPGAKDCLARVDYDEQTDSYSLYDGPHQRFRCYSASQEMQYTNVYNHRLANWESVSEQRSAKQIFAHLDRNLPTDAETVRIHSAGDFAKKQYFKAWILLAQKHPEKIFYAYTKMNPFWVYFRDIIPDNMILTASRGGKWDNLIDEHNLRECVVVYSEQEAHDLGLPIDQDDSHAADLSKRNQNFALVIHGSQQSGSEASKAWTKIKRERHNEQKA